MNQLCMSVEGHGPMFFKSGLTGLDPDFRLRSGYLVQPYDIEK